MNKEQKHILSEAILSVWGEQFLTEGSHEHERLINRYWEKEEIRNNLANIKDTFSENEYNDLVILVDTIAETCP